MGGLKPHHSCLRDDSQVWHPAGLENSVGGLKQNHPVSKMIHWFGIPQAGELSGMFETTSFYPLTTHYPKPNHIPHMIHWFKTTSYYQIPIIQNQPIFQI